MTHGSGYTIKLTYNSKLALESTCIQKPKYCTLKNNQIYKTVQGGAYAGKHMLKQNLQNLKNILSQRFCFNTLFTGGGNFQLLNFFQF